ncbi:MAG: hypothetical protein Q7U68_05635, partial [Candidatus Roizmanbacteria bacterium]|nr:hypothetical protein [Candidatus Roizmanbacteria bacterium]
NVYVSKKLATILTDVDINLDIEKLKFKSFKKDLIDFLTKYQMNSLVKRIFRHNKKSLPAGRQEKPDQIGLF